MTRLCSQLPTAQGGNRRNDVPGVRFFFGTDGTGIVDGKKEPNGSTDDVVPEPASVAMWSFFAVIGVIVQLRRSRNQR